MVLACETIVCKERGLKESEERERGSWSKLCWLAMKVIENDYDADGPMPLSLLSSLSLLLKSLFRSWQEATTGYVRNFLHHVHPHMLLVSRDLTPLAPLKKANDNRGREGQSKNGRQCAQVEILQ